MTRNEIFFCITAAACVAMSYFATDIYLPAMPVLKSYFATTTVAIQSTVSIYMIGIVIAQILIGPLAEHYGFKQTAIPLAIILILSSFICMAATTLTTLYIGRLLQAIGAGGLAVIGRPSFARYFPKERALAIYVTLVPPIALCSPAFAPIIGGLITHYINWQSIFTAIVIATIILLIGLIFKYPLGKLADNDTSIHPIFIFKTYYKLLSNKAMLGYLCTLFLYFVIFYGYMTEAPFILHALGYSTKAIGYSYFSLAIFFLMTTQSSRHLLKFMSYKAVMNLGFCLVIFGLILFWLLPVIFQPSMLTILIGATIYNGSTGLVAPIAMSQSISLFPKASGYASSLAGATGMLGAALGSQFVNITTQGSTTLLALYSFILIIIAWALFLLLATK